MVSKRSCKGNAKHTPSKNATKELPPRPNPSTIESTLSSRGSQTPLLPTQKALLAILSTAFPSMLSPYAIHEILQPLLQQVKTHLFNRDFRSAFGREDYLEAYAVRWSASRALGYSQIFYEVFAHLRIPQPRLTEQIEGSRQSDDKTQEVVTDPKPLSPTTVTCFGGGAGAELCSIAAAHTLRRESDGSTLSVNTIDIADWSSVISALQDGLTTAPVLSAYASPAAKAANLPLIPATDLSSAFYRLDLLELAADDARALQDMLTASALVTIMFTLNELYSTSLPKTQKLLLEITACMKPGALLLVVDSPGSYSTVGMSQNEKKYPMVWLLDHTLLKLASVPSQTQVGDDQTASGTSRTHGQTEDVAAPWEKLISEESEWFRLPEGLRYPIDLENMRYQIHLYRRR